MKLPRDLDGKKLASILRRYGYQVDRQTGNHIRLTCAAKGSERHITVPAHKEIRVGTLRNILGEISKYLKKDYADLLHELFGS